LSNPWAEYVRRIVGGLKQVQIAERTGLAQTNVGRWLRGEPGMPKAESVVALARAFNQPPVEALVAAGYVTNEEASAEFCVRTSLGEYSIDELLAEIRSRAMI
jgi:transcriptional regulator with XRE-family HTH domain